ncbi:MAG: hypothetical protein QM656_10995 [Paracoccaceae bacterium]
MDIFAPLQKVLKIPPGAARLVGAGYLVLAAAAWLISAYDGDPISLAVLAAIILAFGLVVLALSQLSAVLRGILGYVLVLLFSLWIVLLFIQTVFNNPLTPPVVTYQCLVFSSDCRPVSALAPVPASEGRVIATDVTADTGPETGPDPSVQRGAHRVFVQFAGFDRAGIVAMAEKLASGGWDVQGADRGGERLAAAAGVNEIRIFHPEDKQAGALLAAEVAAGLAGAGPLNVRDLSGTALASRVPAGQMEVWVSR